MLSAMQQKMGGPHIWKLAVFAFALCERSIRNEGYSRSCSLASPSRLFYPSWSVGTQHPNNQQYILSCYVTYSTCTPSCNKRWRHNLIRICFGTCHIINWKRNSRLALKKNNNKIFTVESLASLPSVLISVLRSCPERNIWSIGIQREFLTFNWNCVIFCPNDDEENSFVYVSKSFIFIYRQYKIFLQS